jgi:hypothetical protein
MKIRNKKTGEIREVSKFELNQYGLGGQNNKLVKYQNKGEVKKLPGVLTRENIPGDALTSTAKREIVSIYPHYKNMETGFLKGVAYVSPDYKSQEDRELLFKRHRPVAYPSISGAVFDYFKDKSNKWFNTSMQQPFRDKEGDYEASEEAWRMTLGLPVKTKYIIPSKYRPLDEKDKTSRYYTLREDMYNKDLLRKKIQELNLKPGQSAFLPSFAPFVNESYMNQKEFSDVDPLQNFKIGVNKNGKMYFYDKYDFDFEPLSKVTRPYEYEFYNEFKTGGEMIKRADGSYSRRGLWDNIRANAGSGKKPTKEMLNQERKIKNQHQAAYGMEVMGNGGLIKYKEKGEVVNLNNPVNLKEIFIKANVLKQKQNPKPNFEHQINEWLGNTMAKAQRDAESEKWFNPKTKKWEEQDPIDNIRHASAGRYTAEAIANKTGNIPYISNTLGYLGSNLLGAAHEAGTYFTDPRWNNEKSGLFNNFKVITREALEDLYNNNMGAMIGVTPFTPLEKSRIIRNLSDNNLMPDGYGKMDPFHKGIKSNYQQGGQKMPPELAYARFAAAGNLNQLDNYGYQNGGEPDGEMALGQIDAAINKLTNLRKFIQPNSNLEPWVSSKLTMVDDYANSVSDYMMYNPETKEMMELPIEEMKYGGIPMYGPGGFVAKPTTSDSLLLYNNQVLKNKFYKNNSDYTELPIDKKNPLTKNKDINKIINSVNEARKNVNSNMLNNDFGTNKSQKELSNRFGKIINSNVYSAGDIFSGKADTYFNPDSPASYFSNNILPKEWIRYFNNSDDATDVTDVPMYDAIAIKPAHMKTPADWAYMKKTYGVTPTVQQTNTVNRQITTTAKPPVRQTVNTTMGKVTGVVRPNQIKGSQLVMMMDPVRTKDNLERLEMVTRPLIIPKVIPHGELLPVPSKQTVNLTNLIQPGTHPIDIYDRRGNFLRTEFTGDSEGVPNHHYTGEHHYSPRGGNSFLDLNAPIKEIKKYGGLVKYKNGEEVEQKNTTPVVNEKSKLIFRNPVLETPCEGIGCAQLASNELAKMNLIPSRTDAWFMGDAVVKDGGKQIWNRQSGNIDYSTLIPGDIITLDRPGLAHQDDMINNNPTGYTPEKEVEHVGVIVGHDERGVPLIKHGGNHGIRTVIQPIDKLSLYVPDSGITLNYKPFAIYRTKGAENIPIPDNYYNKQYAKFDNSIPLLQKQLDNTEKQNKMIDAFNNNLEMQSRVLGLNPYDIQQLQKIAFGIFGNESKYGTSPKQKPKEYTKRLAHFIRGEKWIPGYDDKTSASLSEMRIKYGDIYDDGNNKLGKQFDELGVKESKLKGFNSDNDYNDEANAAIAILVSNYNKIKNDKDEYGRSKYNYDPTKQTIYGDIPVTEAIAKMYNSGAGVINNENKLRKKPIYAKQAIENAVINFGEVPSLTKTFKNDVIIKNNLQTPLIKPVINRSSETILPENINPRFMYTVPPTVFAEGGGIPERYRNMGFTNVGAKKQSTRPGKKWMVLAKKGDDYKVVHGGYKGMQDFKQHHSEQRKENFWSRMGGRNSSKATDPFSPLYWHKRFGTWEYGGQPMAIGGQNMMNPIVKKDNRNWLEYLKN